MERGKPFAKFTHTQLAYMGCLSSTPCEHCGKFYGRHYGNGQPPKCYSNEDIKKELKKDRFVYC